MKTRGKGLGGNKRGPPLQRGKVRSGSKREPCSDRLCQLPPAADMPLNWLSSESVESRMGAVAWAMRQRSVSHPRSSNRTCEGAARRKGDSSNRGRPVWCEGSGLNVASRRRHRRESDRVVRPLKLGNASGGKGPDFWCAFEDGEVALSLQTPTMIRVHQRKLCREAKEESTPRT
jgi:hypothetical protein